MLDSKREFAEQLQARIKNTGPMTFRDWMQSALYDETDGYYCRSDRIRQGREGDYRTAPESSSLFAATFARYFAELFVQLGSPSQWTIVEAGAGSGEFAQGVLTRLRDNRPDVYRATNYVVSEISAVSRARAASCLSEFTDRLSFRRLDEIGRSFIGIVFSNELIDAFPVHRVTLRNRILRELCVGAGETGFVWLECDPTKQVMDYCRGTELSLSEGQIADVNLDAEVFVSRAAAMIEKGYLITVDYGLERNELLNPRERRQGTLRAFHRHRLLNNVLTHPGKLDLTTTIDWTQIKEAGERGLMETVRFQQLDQFLLAEGLLDELETLAARLPEADVLRLRTSAREMIMPDGLAAHFQVLVQTKQH